MSRRHPLALAAVLCLAAACGSSSPSGDDDDDDDAHQTDAGHAGLCGDSVVDPGEVCDDGTNDLFAGGCRPGCRALDRSDEVFAGQVLSIAIDMDAADWDAMRNEDKSRHSIFGTADCREHVIPSPYHWYSADVTIDGEVMPAIGIRKKGHIGSQSTTKPSLKLRFDYDDDHQRYFGLARLALNNSKSDPSYVRTCLAYRVFAAAGIPAPRCTYADVSLNGAPLGVFVAIDDVDDAFVARQFEDGSGNLYEGTANDFRPSFLGGYEQETNEASDPSRADLAAVLDVVVGAADADLETALEPVLDLPAFYRFWAVESLVWHRDGYTGNANNHFLYADPGAGGRLRFLPWGPDAAFHDPLGEAVMGGGALAFRLYNTTAGRDAFEGAIAAVLTEAWDPADLTSELDRIQASLAPYLSGPALDAAELDGADVADMIEGRAVEVFDALAGPPATVALRQSPCRVPLGPISGSFTTTFGSLAVDAFAAGDGTLTFDLDGAPAVFTDVGARAGTLASGTDRVQMIATMADGRKLTITAAMPDPEWYDSFMSPGSYPLLSPMLTINVTEQDAGNTVLRKFEIGEGTWTFDAVARTPGAAVTGTFGATLYLVPPGTPDL